MGGSFLFYHTTTPIDRRTKRNHDHSDRGTVLRSTAHTHRGLVIQPRVPLHSPCSQAGLSIQCADCTCQQHMGGRLCWSVHLHLPCQAGMGGTASLFVVQKLVSRPL